MQLPTLVIAGAQKSGTTTLAAALKKHPQIFMSHPKELHFFDHNSNFRQGVDFYKSHFRPKPGQVHAGEATPVYMYDVRSRERMAELLVDTKFILILRDPVKRAYSHYWHERRRGSESLETFEEALAAEPERSANSRGRARNRHAYVDRGRYDEQVLPMAEAHGRDHLHVMLMEDLVADPVSALAGVLRFLDLDPAGATALDVRHRNRYRVTDESGQERTAEYPPIEPATRARLVQDFRANNDRLGAWLGRDLAHWNDL